MNNCAFAQRLHRVKQMSFCEICEKLKSKFITIFSYRMNLRRLAYKLDKMSIKLFEDNYQEAAEEEGTINIELKLKRVASGGPFEPYDIALVNRAVTTMIGDAKNIVEIGCGTGMFASQAAQQDPSRKITASEFNHGALEWAKANRAAENIVFCNSTFEDLKDQNFDLLVSIEVVEHVREFADFLKNLASLSNKAIISTPNKNRSAFDSITNTPYYEGHVREWTAGEFYWVLKIYYNDVQLYTIPDFNKQLHKFMKNPQFCPTIEKCSVLTRENNLIAICENPK